MPMPGLMADPRFWMQGQIGPGQGLMNARQATAGLTPPTPPTTATGMSQRVLFPSLTMGRGAYGVHGTGELLQDYTPGPNDIVMQPGAEQGFADVPGVGPINVPFISRGSEGGMEGANGGTSDAGEGGNSASSGEGDGGDGFAKGGKVTGAKLKGKNPKGPDDGSAPLDTGEFVVQKAAAQMYGPQVMNALNQGLIDPAALTAMLKMPTMRGQ